MAQRGGCSMARLSTRPAVQSVERALTLLALAELHRATGDHPAAAATLAAARALLEPLEARPALARAAALAARLEATP